MAVLTPAPVSENYQRLRDTLRELFQLDQADLDFGIYRILNQRRKEVEAFLEEQLPQRVREALRANTDAATDELRQQLELAERHAHELGIAPENSPKVQELRKAIGNGASADVLENEVFSLLTTFFKRYYKQGDFISQRRYKKDTYAIPYEGEEVKLHWANHDQYYVKTSEHFKQYRLKLPGGKRVHFELREASTEQANNKAQAGKERRFKLVEEAFFSTHEDTLTLWFTYEPTDKKVKQDELLREAFERIAPIIPASFQAELLRPMPTDKQRDRTALHKHLKDYAAKNTFDYFIHKDLGGFLGRELDFFIKNEVLLLDDVHLDDEREYARQRRMVRALKAAAKPIIEFLAQLEDFQKKLWLKKKFVVETNWCITLDRVPEELYPEISANEEQRAAWEDLFAISALEGGDKRLTVDFLKRNPYLVLDTRFFTEAPQGKLPLKYRLLNELSGLDKQSNGLLINSENFQALRLMQGRYRGEAKCFYIDPPYNTGEDGFIYKDSFQHSSWIALLDDRFRLIKNLLPPDGVVFTSIGEEELDNLTMLCSSVFGESNVLERTARIQKKGSDKGDFYNPSLDYVVTCVFDKEELSGFTINLFDESKFKKIETIGDRAGEKYEDSKSLYQSSLDARKNQRYYVECPDGTFAIPPGETFPEEERDGAFVFPRRTDGCWRWSYDQYLLKKHLIVIRESEDTPLVTSSGKRSRWNVYTKRYLKDAKAKGNTPVNFIQDYPNALGTEEVQSLGLTFSYPKPSKLVRHLMSIASADTRQVAFDCFAGSGTTGHAVVEMNRADNVLGGNDGQRKYILVEMGEYFDTVTKPRMQKVVYSRTWKDGKPMDRTGISHCFKYLRLESYEDTLNNLHLKRTPDQTGTLGLDGAFAEDHLLHYLLDVEATGSLLGAQHFADPFNVTLRITRHNETKEERVDLVETFNYLLGLVVDTQEYLSGFVQVRGTLLTGEKVLVVWRNTQEKDNAALNEFFRRRDFRTRAKEFDLIYVNGDNNLQNERLDDEHWKVRMIEEEFLKRMFEGKDV